MKVLTRELEFDNDSNNKIKLNYVWIGVRGGDFVGTIDTRKQANDLINLLKETVFVEEQEDDEA